MTVPAAFGFAEAQPGQSFTTSGLAGTYMFATEDPGDNSTLNDVGPIKILASGNAAGTQNSSGSKNLHTSTFQSTLAITNADRPGTGNIKEDVSIVLDGPRIVAVGGPDHELEFDDSIE